jgi:hypothetical protein
MSLFRQALPKDKLSITFDTNYRDSGTVSMPTFTFNESLKRVGKINVDKIVFPCSFFIFNTGNNTIGTINATTISVSASTYTASTLAAAIQTAIRATGGGFSAATCTYSENRFTIASGSVSTFSLNTATSTLLPLMGFNTDHTTVTTATSDFLVYETSFVIVADNRSFIINQGGTDYTFYISAGNYTGNTLAIELQTQILLQLSGFTVSYNSNNYTLTFTGSSSFIFKSTGSASNALGFRANVSSTSNIVTSPYPIDIIGPTSVIIKSRILTNIRQMVVRTDDVYLDFVYEVLLNGDIGQIIYDDPIDSAELFMAASGGATVSSIDFRICDDTGKILDLGVTGRWKICLIFEIY